MLHEDKDEGARTEIWQTPHVSQQRPRPCDVVDKDDDTDSEDGQKDKDDETSREKKRARMGPSCIANSLDLEPVKQPLKTTQGSSE